MSDTPVPHAGTEQTILLQPGTVAEVMTPENRLIYVGKIEKIQNGGVYIRELNDDTLPMVLVNKPVKVRFYQETGNIVLHAKVCGSTIHMWKVDRLQSTFVREQRAFFRQSISIDIEARCSRRSAPGGPGPSSPATCWTSAPGVFSSAALRSLWRATGSWLMRPLSSRARPLFPSTARSAGPASGERA